MDIQLVKEGGDGKKYQANGFRIYYRNENTITGDNDINESELIYLITGKAEITVKDKTWIVEAPAKIEFPAKTYHKINAITDISFILFFT